MSSFGVDREALKQRLSSLEYNVTQNAITEEYILNDLFSSNQIIIPIISVRSLRNLRNFGRMTSIVVSFASNSYSHVDVENFVPNRIIKRPQEFGPKSFAQDVILILVCF
ncbi:hypothetical protein SSS_01241 [Sarcoptes scabiei]|nr:hypothetical protein SSS_01241 [Sarcoptes scabiei]